MTLLPDFSSLAHQHAPAQSASLPIHKEHIISLMIPEIYFCFQSLC